MKLEFKPLTVGRWKALDTLFGERGACGGCWCMTWRLSPPEFKKNQGARNKAALRRLAGRRPAVGILAFVRGNAIGWCSVAPREEFSYLARSRVLKPIDAQRVWSISCLFVLPEFRRKGVSVALLRAAVSFASRHGASIIEGYPIIPYSDQMPPAFAWTGTHSAFLAAGFEEAARGSPARPIMRASV